MKKRSKWRAKAAASSSLILNKKELEKQLLSQLYLDLEELMRDPMVLTDAKINRKTMARILGTNEKYVFYAIRKYYKNTVSNYIKEHRIHYAKKLLADNPRHYTIESIAVDAGFNNRSTFHKAFKEYFGITPSRYRDSLYPQDK